MPHGDIDLRGEDILFIFLLHRDSYPLSLGKEAWGRGIKTLN